MFMMLPFLNFYPHVYDVAIFKLLTTCL